LAELFPDVADAERAAAEAEILRMLWNDELLESR
jgi:hypothetical protein